MLRGGLSLVLARILWPSPATAQATEGARLRARTSGLLDGRIRSGAVRGRDGVLRGHALGLVDASFADVMGALCEVEAHGRILPTVRRASVVERSRGRALVELTGEAPLVGRYALRAVTTIRGHDDGTHTIALVPSDPDSDMHVRMVLSRTPGGVRSIVGVSISLDRRSLPAVGAERVHRNAAIGTIAGIRREVRASRR